MTDLHPPPPHFSQNARVSANIWDWPCLLSLTGNSGVKGKGRITFLFIWSTHGKRFLLTSSWACQSYFSTINEVCFQSVRVPGHLVTADQFWYAVSKAHLRVNEQARNVSLEIQEIVDEIMSLGMLRGFFGGQGASLICLGIVQILNEWIGGHSIKSSLLWGCRVHCGARPTSPFPLSFLDV